MTMETQALIDPAALEKLSQYGPPGFIEKLVVMFEQNAHKQMEQLHMALDASDGDQAAFAAHAMKSSAGQVGAVEIHRILSRIEAHGKEGQLDEARRSLAGLDDILPVSIEQLRKLAGLPSP
jgi:HPt (histidine-containing phosphotransfer) domain-containing protein